MKSITVLKMGGDLLTSLKKRDHLVRSINDITTPVIIVHGGGNYASELAQRVGGKTVKLNGRRITDSVMLEIVELAFSRINKQLSSHLSYCGKPSVGLAGGDINLIRAVKRDTTPIDYGYVGDFTPNDINCEILLLLINNGITPVISALSQNQTDGSLLNSNADTIASVIATALTHYYDVELIYAFDKPGIMLDVNDHTTTIPKLTLEEFIKPHISESISDGMIPKVENAFRAINSGVSKVRICSYLNFNEGTLIE